MSRNSFITKLTLIIVVNYDFSKYSFMKLVSFGFQILMVLAKMDASYRQMRNEALLMLQFNRLKKEVLQNVTTAEVSATTGEGLSSITAWLSEK